MSITFYLVQLSVFSVTNVRVPRLSFLLNICLNFAITMFCVSYNGFSSIHILTVCVSLFAFRVVILCKLAAIVAIRVVEISFRKLKLQEIGVYLT